jgi:DNA-binding NarL/FixJ family response regulator
MGYEAASYEPEAQWDESVREAKASPTHVVLALTIRDAAGSAELLEALERLARQEPGAPAERARRQVVARELAPGADTVSRGRDDGQSANTSDQRGDGRLPRLTGAQLQVMRLLDQGLSVREVAARLAISVDTVYTHTRNVAAALRAHGYGVRSTVQALGVLRRLGRLREAGAG